MLVLQKVALEVRLGCRTCGNGAEKPAVGKRCLARDGGNPHENVKQM